MSIDPDNQYVRKVVRIGQIGAAGQFKIVSSSEDVVRPEPFPSTRKREQWLRFVDGLYRDWGSRWECGE